jgi:hypothetical protein
MEANRILPDLQASILCEQVRQEANGNLFIVGVLGIIPIPQFPIKASQLCILNRWTAGVGTFVESTQFLAPDQTTVMRSHEVQFQLKDPRTADSRNRRIFDGEVQTHTRSTRDRIRDGPPLSLLPRGVRGRRGHGL